MNDALLSKIRSLLAKAESPAATPEEAETYSAKAEELMTKYAIDAALVADRDHTNERPIVRDFLIDAPYQSPKGTLLNVIARAFNARAVQTGKGLVKVVGFASDLEMNDALYTSLLLQATSAMLHEHDSSRSFRTGFLYGFATTVGKRLSETKRKVTEESEPGTALVLADRSGLVDAALRQEFPNLRRVTRRVSNSNGYGAGGAAGNRADLGGARIGSRRGLTS